jgi:hypothetical protein
MALVSDQFVRRSHFIEYKIIVPVEIKKITYGLHRSSSQMLGWVSQESRVLYYTKAKVLLTVFVVEV